MVKVSLLGPYILPPQADSDSYFVFLQEVLPELLNEVSAPMAHVVLTGQGTISLCKVYRTNGGRTFTNRWTGCNDPVAWPPRFLDLSPMDFSR
ncbi:hypothetical protein TNCV_1600871 [Trichonephila clavipes]|nr:hypothetical protein TNCV_1600871 [Trichonephila clavipes]